MNTRIDEAEKTVLEAEERVKSGGVTDDADTRITSKRAKRVSPEGKELVSMT